MCFATGKIEIKFINVKHFNYFTLVLVVKIVFLIIEKLPQTVRHTKEIYFTTMSDF